MVVVVVVAVVAAEMALLPDTRRPDVVEEASPSPGDGAVAAAGAFVAVPDVAADGAPDSVGVGNEGADDDVRRLLAAVGISATARGATTSKQSTRWYD